MMIVITTTMKYKRKKKPHGNKTPEWQRGQWEDAGNQREKKKEDVNDIIAPDDASPLMNVSSAIKTALSVTFDLPHKKGFP